jgi:prophage regulatory protein
MAEQVLARAILRLPKVQERTGLSRSSIYLRASEGTFPQPIKLGTRASGWIADEIDAWIAAQIAATREGPAS